MQNMQANGRKRPWLACWDGSEVTGSAGVPNAAACVFCTTSSISQLVAGVVPDIQVIEQGSRNR